MDKKLSAVWRLLKTISPMANKKYLLGQAEQKKVSLIFITSVQYGVIISR